MLPNEGVLGDAGSMTEDFRYGIGTTQRTLLLMLVDAMVIIAGILLTATASSKDTTQKHVGIILIGSGVCAFIAIAYWHKRSLHRNNARRAIGSSSAEPSHNAQTSDTRNNSIVTVSTTADCSATACDESTSSQEHVVILNSPDLEANNPPEVLELEEAGSVSPIVDDIECSV